MKRYEAYKDSGVEWIGEIPREWVLSKIKYEISCLDGLRIPVEKSQRNDGPYPYWGAGSVTCYVDKYLFDEEVVLLGEDGAPFFDPYRPVSFYVNEKVWVNNHMHVLKAKDRVFAKFLVYFLNSIDFNEYINGSVLNKLTQTSMNDIVLALPPFPEQHAIAAYLDHKVSKIDASVSAIDKQIEDLKAYRQSIISETVTKGLNHNAKMKDSGVEWIGEIPEGWITSKIKFEVDMVLGKMLEDKEPKNNDGTYTLEPYLKSRNIGMLELYNNIDQVDKMWFSSKEKAIYELKDGDLVMNEGGDIGKVSIWKNPGFKCYIQNSVHKLTPHFNITDAAYLQYLISYIATRGYFNKVVSSISISHLTKEKLAETPLVLPSLPEQHAIAAYLDAKTSKIASAITSLEQQRSDLEALKQSVISEAVTGKIDVRGRKPQSIEQ